MTAEERSLAARRNYLSFMSYGIPFYELDQSIQDVIKILAVKSLDLEQKEAIALCQS